MMCTLPVCRAGAGRLLGACLGLAGSTLAWAAPAPAPAPANLATSAATPPGHTAPRPPAWAAPVDVPPLSYRSALADYRPAIDVPRTPWRDANDTVGRIGGWRSYAREAQGTDSAAPAHAPAAPAAPDAPDAPVAPAPARPGAHPPHRS